MSDAKDETYLEDEPHLQSPILLHFLGTGQTTKEGKKTGRYAPTKYAHRGKKPVETSWVAEAVATFYGAERVFLAATAGAREFTLKNIKNDLSGKLQLTEIDIPDGKGDLEIWQMFEKIVNAIPEKTRLVIDVTNGFRSQPMLAVAMAVYLRTLKNVEIVDIVYGAWEARDEKNVAPVISLRPFIDLIDWTFAIEDFERDGNTGGLSDLLHDMQERAHSDQHLAQYPDLPQNLKGAADALDRVTRALHLLRPRESAKEANRVIRELDESSEDIEKFAKPFAPLIDKTQDELRFLSYDLVRNSPQDVLTAQLKMIRWYLDKQKHMQAISLAREWVVTYLTYQFNMKPTNRKQREEANDRLNSVIRRRPGFQRYERYVIPEFRKLVPEIQKCRNDIDHANDIHSADKLKNKIEWLCNELISIGEKISKGV